MALPVPEVPSSWTECCRRRNPTRRYRSEPGKTSRPSNGRTRRSWLQQTSAHPTRIHRPGAAAADRSRLRQRLSNSPCRRRRYRSTAMKRPAVPVRLLKRISSPKNHCNRRHYRPGRDTGRHPPPDRSRLALARNWIESTKTHHRYRFSAARRSMPRRRCPRTARSCRSRSTTDRKSRTGLPAVEER